MLAAVAGTVFGFGGCLQRVLLEVAGESIAALVPLDFLNNTGA